MYDGIKKALGPVQKDTAPPSPYTHTPRPVTPSLACQPWTNSTLIQPWTNSTLIQPWTSSAKPLTAWLQERHLAVMESRPTY
ncbi:hypothetical protein ACOMHN_015921 [Nucella lapillus]